MVGATEEYKYGPDIFLFARKPSYQRKTYTQLGQEEERLLKQH